MGEFTLGGTTLRARTTEATKDTRLRNSLARAVRRFDDGRVDAFATLDDPNGLRRAARRMRNDILSELPRILERFADNVLAAGGHVHWATDAAVANRVVVDIARHAGARLVVKGKSMATEETALNDALERAGCEIVETDLGEWIIQLAHDTPSHIIAPAVHLDRYQIRDILQPEAPAGQILDTEPAALAAFAREQLRARFLGRRPRCDGLQPGRRRDGLGASRRERGQRAAQHDRAARARRGDGNGAHRRDVGPSRPDRQPAGALGYRPTPEHVHEHRHGAAPRGRGRRPRRTARRHSRQPSQRHTRHRVHRGAQLHPLRRVPQRVPRLPRSGRPRLRMAFLDRLRRQLSEPVPAHPAHPLPPPLDGLPSVRSSLLDSADVIGSFVRNATSVRVMVHDIAGPDVPPDLIADIIERHHVERAVVSREPEAVRVGDTLRAAGVVVDAATIDACANAHLGVTGATAAIATTGTVVLRSDTTGSRSASLLPPVHLCVLAASRVVETSTDVLAGLGAAAMPSNLVLITGPSRSGDIEQIITVGVHGPPVVEGVLLRDA